jgi:PadR family transcriptional regulator, regulatory protein PadR
MSLIVSRKPRVLERVYSALAIPTLKRHECRAPSGPTPPSPTEYFAMLRLIRLVLPLDIHSIAMYCSAMLTKELVAASTEPLILSLLSKGESYGYALIQEVKQRSGDKIEWTDGMLYPVLHRMEREGWIESRWGEAENGRKRKYYSLLKDGRKALKKQREQWAAVSGLFNQLWREQYV